MSRLFRDAWKVDPRKSPQNHVPIAESKVKLKSGKPVERPGRKAMGSNAEIRP